MAENKSTYKKYIISEPEVMEVFFKVFLEKITLIIVYIDALYERPALMLQWLTRALPPSANLWLFT